MSALPSKASRINRVPSPLQSLAKGFQPTANAGVDKLIAHPGHHAADDFRVHATLDLDAATGLALQPLRHQLLLWRGERDRGADLGQLDALRLAHSIGKRLGECGEKLDPF